MNQWAQGGIARLEVFYRSGAGAPVDPPDPSIDVLDPAGVVAVADLELVRDGLGSFHALWPVPGDAELGVWTSLASGTLDGALRQGAEEFEIVVPGEVATVAYGATVEDVKALLPRRRWTPDTRPTEDDVAGFLVALAGGLAARVGIFTAPPRTEDQVNRLNLAAKWAVVLGGAAFAEAGGHPEKVRPNDVSSYAAWLWDRHLEAVASLEDLADAFAPGEAPAGVEPVADEPAWSFPEPVGWAERGI